MKLLNRLRALQNRDEEIDDEMFSQYNFTLDSDVFSSDVGITTEEDYELEMDKETSLAGADLMDLVEENDIDSGVEANAFNKKLL